MGDFTITAGQDHFFSNGRPWFYLADTVWSAFTNAEEAEWVEYLEYRREQGFNALQMNILPQWDRSLGKAFPEPFGVDRKGRWDFSRPNSEYFDHARAMTTEARRRGFVPALVLLWCNHVPGTWAASRGLGPQIDAERVEHYIRYAAGLFAAFDPIYLVSGDTDFNDPQTEAYYLAALKALGQAAPRMLTTFHLNPGVVLPARLVESSELSFYMYQSGHHLESQDRAWRLAEQASAYPVRRPILNGEPCYEGIGTYQRYGRFGAFEVRRAIWQSLLAGAKAGVAYGAHGLWSWHGPDLDFPHAETWNQPFVWREALRLPGASDAAFARWLFETHRLHELGPAQELLEAPAEIRAAARADLRRAALYVPYPTPVRLKLDGEGLEWTGVDLANRRVFRPSLRFERESLVLQPLASNADALFLAERF